ncbi:hypothetical protein [Phenylobacterium sp. J367]|uniref:hypothetical protein n=1 Tax=Phenylobacterium sp. J367 TaxID=2898435 RepID=UPI002150928B|nr:hypothetical protein [Phenylobacterium sp. J367]MCR5877253.1 hypothetical protein [Phenylobacterium sp. J367]
MPRPYSAVARQPRHAYARLAARRGPARSTSVGPEVLASMALDGRNPRRRPSVRLLRLLALLVAMALCGAFWLGLSDAALRVLG